ncbi:hypothetical protein BE04_22865 [Sorangium cellulosum]|uniref:Uncharacterized protein n=2 Tax=Sorangium cellulosum TaxID=56 RepID=A0A150Q8K1_SORCE|nr:hypothetical protein SCE1572_51455 [Sorangium cellulosum So0157-2]KYF64294.1 hypothetical protein BE04_22865 [Sorangium cellulosum]
MSSRGTEGQVDVALQQVKERWNPAWPGLSEMLRLLDVDWSGDDAVRIWVILNDEDDQEWPEEHMEAIDEAIRASLRDAGVDAWPYIHFRGKSEQEELIERESEEEDAEDDLAGDDEAHDGPSSDAAAAQRRV